MGGVKNTADNLGAAIAGETYEIETMYPEFVSGAQEESEKMAEKSFSDALAVEKVHQQLFKDVLAKLEAGEDMPESEYHICPVCGYPSSPEAPDRCPICSTPKEKFYKV
jgi:rubrerythrin